MRLQTPGEDSLSSLINDSDLLCLVHYTAFQIIMQIGFKCHKIYIFFSIKLMNGVVSQCSLDH